MSNNLPSRPERPSGNSQDRSSASKPQRRLPTTGKREGRSLPKTTPRGLRNENQSSSQEYFNANEGLRKKAPSRPKPNVSSRPKPTQRRVNSDPSRARKVNEEIENVSPSTPARREYIDENQYEAPIAESYNDLGMREPSPIVEDEIPQGFDFDDPDDINENNTDYLNEGNVIDSEDEDSPFLKEEKEEEVSPRATKKNRKKKKAPKQKKSQEKFANQGARTTNLIIRGVIVAVVLAVIGMNIKVIFFPQAVPSPDQVVSVVNESNGILGFPIGEGTTFVQEFASVYLNVQREENTDPSTLLEKYVPDGSADQMAASLGALENTQKITRGPFVSSKVEQIDENNANFTISAQLNDSSWIYLLVPVYSDPKNDSFVVSGTPTFISPPGAAKYNAPNDTRAKDDELSEKVTSDVENFFKAWSSSDRDNLTRLISPEATVEAKLGLRNAVIFSNLDSLTIFEASDANPDNIRDGVALVTWESTQSGMEGESGITYKQSYNIVIEERDTRWYVKDIQGGVTTSN